MSKMRAMQVPRTASVQLIRSKIIRLVSLLVWLLPFALASVASGQQGSSIQGTVFDSNRAALRNVKIEYHAASETRLTTTDENGSFNFPNLGPGTLLASCPGFTAVKVELTRESLSDPLQIYLQPAPIVERIVITPVAADRISPVPNSQFSISRQEIEVSGSLALDDVLRETPGFTLFRRSGSLTANPTSQGVSLRGVGALDTNRTCDLPLRRGLLYPLSYEGDVADFTRSAYDYRHRRKWDPSLPKSHWIPAFAGMNDSKVRGHAFS